MSGPYLASDNWPTPHVHDSDICQECPSGCDDGKQWNNADPTSGQWAKCETCEGNGCLQFTTGELVMEIKSLRAQLAETEKDAEHLGVALKAAEEEKISLQQREKKWR